MSSNRHIEKETRKDRKKDRYRLVECEKWKEKIKSYSRQTKQ